MCVSAERFSADSETNCCSHIMRLSQGNIDFCGMYSQGELRVLMLSLCWWMTINGLILCFLLEAQCCYKVPRVCTDRTGGSGTVGNFLFD